MARMIPNDIDEFKTDGERQFYKFLESVAKPDSQYVSWYLPDIEGKEPDFLLFSDSVGLIVFEVKDWALDQIREANPNHFILHMGKKTERRKNPFQQARDYCDSLMDKIKDDGKLVSKEQKHYGNPKVPIDCGVVFPNINKYEYTQHGLDKVLDTKIVFFSDELHPQSDICQDGSGKCFFEILKKKFFPKFAFKLTQHEYDHLRLLIFPTVRIDTPQRDGAEKYAQQMQRLKILDHNQEALARKYDGGHRIISGPSGSGKTLILVHKAAFLKQYNPAIKGILFVCYNITLVNYIKRLLSEKKVGLGEGGVEVYHFYELCSKILDEEIHYEKEDEDYYDLVVSEALSRLKDKDIKYDAILVDEGQDFSDDMYKVVTRLLNPHTNNLTIALDEDQNLYGRKLSWKKLGVEARGRIHKVPYVYRNTMEISRFADRFLGKDVKQEESGNLELFPDLFDFHGPEPEMKRFRSMEEIISSVADEIEAVSDKKEYPPSEIAIIYAKKSFKDEAIRSLPKRFGKVLSSRGIMHNWASEDYRSKRSYDITTDSVTISTIHSTKGLDYACVFLVGLDSLEPDGWTEGQIRNLTYVAITRARHRLFIPYVEENDVISRLLGSLKANRENA
jgi:superfamily I DNA and RNA helicase